MIGIFHDLEFCGRLCEAVATNIQRASREEAVVMYRAVYIYIQRYLTATYEPETILAGAKPKDYTTVFLRITIQRLMPKKHKALAEEQSWSYSGELKCLHFDFKKK